MPPDSHFLKMIREIQKYNPKADFALIRKAHDFAKSKHEGQKRQSGEDYFIHPMKVTETMVRLKADTATICAALLHDVVEDTSVPIEEIRKLFGSEIAELVEGLTKIERVKFTNAIDYTAENIRKIMLATTKDIRVMLIKLADRLHNMATLRHLSPQKQKEIAKETLDIYAPIAHKLGIASIKGELEDMALKYLDPDAYKLLVRRIAQKREEREAKTQEFIKEIKGKLKEQGIDADIQGRAKYFYSIYKKMKEDHKEFNEIFDLIAIRVVVSTVPQCYAALGIIHELYAPKPRRFKDYIAVPKSNGYQSLHTSVIGGHGRILEIQIRTKDMHIIAEEGLAAHWRYKGHERDKKFDRKLAWLKQLLEWKRHSASAKDFVETVQIDLFENEIVVFTPKGDPVSLPEGSTVVDFAYEVHTNIGNHCARAEVNGKIVPLNHVLKSGDIVHIITKGNAKPARNWLTFVKTGKARSHIRAAYHITAEAPHEQKPEGAEEKKSLLERIELVDRKISLRNFKFSGCCQPKFGDFLSAYLMKDGKLTIHRSVCPNVHTLDQNRKVKVRWKAEEDAKGVETLRVTVIDRVGMLAELLEIISGSDINIDSIRTRSKRGHVSITFKLRMPTGVNIKDIFPKLRGMKDVLDVKRLRSREKSVGG